LLAWAARRSGVIVEDDYDGEYRYDRTAIGALQGLAPERIIYVGSASKILAPGLRLGWMAVGGPWLERAVDVKRHLDNGSPILEQLTYAHFVGRGELDRHVRRTRRLYRSRRDALLQALSHHCPDWQVHGAAAGLHLVAQPPLRSSIARIVARAAAASVRLYPLSDYASRATGRRGLVFGYAGLTEAEIAEAVRRMKRAMA
jgi:GntR family transcriptional regulator/MocR family aminotransferase